jgi:hypothetical protein
MPLYRAPDGLPPGFGTSLHPGHWHLHHIALPDDRPGNFTPVGRPELSITACFHTPGSLTGKNERAGFAGLAVRPERGDPRRRDQILFAARCVETQPSLIGFSAV